MTEAPMMDEEIPDDFVSDNIDPANLTDEELREEIAARKEIAREIANRILENDSQHLFMDPRLRADLSAERREANHEAMQLQSILTQRLKSPKKPKGPPPEHFERMRQQEEAAERRRSENRARHAAAEAADKTLCQMFVKVASRALTAEQFAELWSIARAMFPDNPAWEIEKLDKRGNNTCPNRTKPQPS